MSRRLPDGTESTFLNEWAKRKIMADLENLNFAEIAEFSRLYAYFYIGVQSVQVEEDWCGDRMLDIFDIVREMRQIPSDPVRMEELEIDLIKLLALVAEYEQINGSLKPGDGIGWIGKVWRIPEGWGKSD